MGRPTIKDVANAAGVSVGLVSMVLNAKRDHTGRLVCHVKESTAQRVLDAVASLDYKMNKQAASLRSGKHKTIAVIVPDISNKFFAEIAGHIEKVAFDAGYIVIFCSSSEEVDKLANLVDNCYCNNVEGMIIAPCAGSEEIIRKVNRLGIPLVLLDRVLPGLADIPSITLDNRTAGVMAAECFYRQGCKRIGVICFDTMISSLNERVLGVVEKAESCGMEVDVRLLSYNSGVEAFRRIVEEFRRNGVDALFFPSNNAAIKGFSAVNSLGISISKDIAFLGFDECDVFEVSVPRISHITQSTSDFGQQSCRMLLDLIGGEPVTSQVLSPTFVKG